MEKIQVKQIKKETVFLNTLYKKHKRVNKEFQSILSKKGYELCDLGTGMKSYTCSGIIGEKHISNDAKKYFGIGIYNISKKCRKNGIHINIYRAWIKEIN